MSKKFIGEYVEEGYSNSVAHGFWTEFDQTHDALLVADGTEALADKYTIDVKLSKLALMMSELGEAVEGVRKPAADQHCPQFSSEEIELADCVIRIFDYCGAFGLRLEAALDAKMAYNESRPYKHGKGA
jgi:NTP pyrophosphatase (non-canonical NTP hydrolase)